MRHDLGLKFSRQLLDVRRRVSALLMHELTFLLAGGVVQIDVHAHVKKAVDPFAGAVGVTLCMHVANATLVEAKFRANSQPFGFTREPVPNNMRNVWPEINQLDVASMRPLPRH